MERVTLSTDREPSSGTERHVLSLYFQLVSNEVDLTLNDLLPVGIERWNDEAQVPPRHELGHFQELDCQKLAPTGTHCTPCV